MRWVPPLIGAYHKIKKGGEERKSKNVDSTKKVEEAYEFCDFYLHLNDFLQTFKNWKWSFAKFFHGINCKDPKVHDSSV